MGKIVSTATQMKGQLRFRFEEPEERKELFDAGNYFIVAHLLLSKGMNYKVSNKSATPFFARIMKGGTTISLENWERVKHYAELGRQGQEYDEETFVRPDFDV